MALIGIAVAILWPDKKWIGYIALGLSVVLVTGWIIFEVKERLGASWGSLSLSILAGAIFGGVAAALIWYNLRPTERRSYTSAATESNAVAQLSRLGWTVKPGSDDIEFEIQTKPLPPMKESAVYFAQLQKPWRLHFQQVSSIEGLHELATIKGCSKIEINAGEFSDISELRGFESLSSLSISQLPLNEGAVVDASPLSSLSNLRELNLNLTKIKNIDALTTLTKLEELNLGGTLIRDLSPLVHHHLLKSLEIRDTGVTDLTPINGIQSLNELGVSGKQIPGLAGLVNLQNLKRLRIIEQSKIDLAPVSKLTSLEYLWVWGPMPEVGPLDISPLRSLTKLRELMLTGMGLGVLTKVTDIEALGELKEMTKLTLGDMEINDLAFVINLTHLEEIGINRMPVTSIAPLRYLKSLKSVGLNVTNVTDISPLLDLPNLERLSVTRTPARADVLTELERRGVKIQR
jgi:hypothetical protein